MNFKKNYIYIADKCIDTTHPFIDGMMLNSIPSEDNNVIVVYFRSPNGTFQKNSAISTSLKRNLLGRLLQGPAALLRIKNILYDKKIKNIVFVRNEIFAYFFFVIIKKFKYFNYEIYFQSSFPHEENIKYSLVKSIYKIIFKYCLKSTSKVFVVSENAIDRIHNYLPTAPTYAIPLCTDFKTVSSSITPTGKIKFIYIGTFSKSRNLDIILSAFNSISDTADFELHIYGGQLSDFLKEYPETKEIAQKLINNKYLEFKGKVNRLKIQHAITNYDVGINLIPPSKQYQESSSTKIGEYLSQGVPTISSCNIPYHDKIHAYADIGWTCEFSQPSIEKMLYFIITHGREKISMKRTACILVYEKYLNYDSYKNLILD